MELTIIVEQDEDGTYVASAMQLRGVHTQAKTVEELRTRMDEAIKLFLNDPKITFETTIVGIGIDPTLMRPRD